MKSSIGRGVACAGCAALLLAGACTSGDSTSSPSSPGSLGDPVATTTITITASGASPRSLIIPLGSQVTFINNDTIPHEMYSDPHPEHTDCPEFDSVGHLAPGQSRQTTNLITARVCNFHDHINPMVNSLTGSIRIQ